MDSGSIRQRRRRDRKTPQTIQPRISCFLGVPRLLLAMNWRRILSARELVSHPGVQYHRGRAHLTSLRARRRSPAVFEQPTGSRRRKNFCSRSQNFSVEVCNVYRTRPQFQPKSTKRIWFPARLFRRRHARAARTSAQHSSSRANHFRRHPSRHSHGDHSCSPLRKTRARRSGQRYADSALLSHQFTGASPKTPHSANRTLGELCATYYSPSLLIIPADYRTIRRRRIPTSG